MGPCKIIPSEYPNIRCCNVDVVVKSGIGIDQELIDPLLAELSSVSPDPVIAYRGKHRWLQTFEPVRLEKPSISTARLREKGVYLITGGLGGIGLALAEHLAKTLQARLVLVGRSFFPGRQEWELWLSHHDAQDPVSIKIQKLKSIEALGAEALVVSADVSNLKQMDEVISQAKERFGKINGVIHSAGIADYAGVIQRRSREMTDEVLAPKVKGTLVLDTLLSGTELDFFLLCSSLGSILYHSKFGQVAYNAANEFLDAFACHKTRKDRTFAVAVNWTDWQEAGMSVDAVKRWIRAHDFPDDPSILQSALSPSIGIRDSMLSSEGVEVFERVLANEFARVVVSTQDLGSMIKEDGVSIGPAFLKIMDQITRSKPNHPRPQLRSSFVAPRGNVEQTVAKIWQELIGFEDLGIHDNFFELGGDSLVAARVISRLRDEFQLEIPIRSFFDQPTVADIASIIAQRQTERQGSSSEFGES
jgi:NAD(P)-dependent dehydrogenase (short-subunit alcohol dehydrogenase family)/acyl carrier protein